MIRLFSILFLAVAFNYVSLIDGYAQDLIVPTGWKVVSVCEIKFLIPIDLKGQKSKGIDSCVADFKSSKFKIGIDYGSHGTAYKNDGAKVDFKEEFTEIDGRKIQLITYKDAPNNRQITAGLYALIYEAQDGAKTSLKITIEVESEKSLETAKQIFQSILFIKTINFANGLIDVFGNYKENVSRGPDFHVKYISLNEPKSSEKANLAIYYGNFPSFHPPKNAITKKAKFGDETIKWRIWSSREKDEIYYHCETVILNKDGRPVSHLFINGTNKQRVEDLEKAISTYRTSKIR